VKLWDAATLDELAILDNKTTNIWSVAFSPDGKRLATGSTEGTVRLWDVAARKQLATVEKRKECRFEPQPVLALAYAPDGKSAAIAGEDGGVQVCELPTGIQRHVLKGHADVDCLLIDEGFHSLDPETLRVASDAIHGLQVGGRMVGIITHIPALQEEFDQQVLVAKLDGTSRVQIVR
jgi:WD40 repeat protein